MKRKWFQKAVSIGLTAAMILGLCACGDNSDGSSGKKGGTSSDPSLAKQYVYSYDEFDIPKLGDDFNVRSVCEIDGRIYMLVQIYHWDEGGNDNDIKILSMNQDGSDTQTVDLQMGDDTEEASNETSNETSGDNSEGEADSAEQAADSFYEYTGYGNFVFSSTDGIYAVKNYYMEDYSDPENPVYERSYFISSWGMDGSLRWEKPVEELSSEEEDVWINSMVAMEDGSIMMLLSGNTTSKIVMDAEGNFSPRQEIKDDQFIFQNMSNMLAKQDGSIYLMYYNENDNYSLYIATYDYRTDEVSEGVKMPGSLSWSGYNAVAAGADTDLAISTSSGLFTYNIGDENLTQIMSFINSDLNTDQFFNIVMLDQDHFIGFYYDREDYNPRGGYFTKVDPKDIPDKEVLVIAGNYLNYEIKKRVVDFNKTNDQYRIVVKEYESYNSSDDYMAGYTQLNNDILGGNMPDILMVDSQVPVENYISKGLLADVGKLIEEDEELSQTEFMENVFNAYKVNDKLYYVIPYFYVRTLMGKQSILGDRSSWTMQEFEDLMASMPEGTQGIGELTRSYFFSIMMGYCGRDFVDVSTGKCNFNTPEFIELLEYAKTLPEQLDEDYYGEDYWMNYESQYRDDRTVLMDCSISSMTNMNRNINGYFGEDVTFIGFPTESGKGSILDVGNYYVLSAKSANLDGAWEFVRYYLTEEYQDTMEWNIPVNKNSYEKWVAKGMEKPYYMDENDQKVEYDEYVYINGEQIPLPVMTKEQTEMISNFIMTVDKPAYYNREVQNIIDEESAAFFTGQKSAADVADIIQSRVQIYVNENR